VSELFEKSTLFQKALKRVLRPLVRALIAQGVTAPAFYQIVKSCYIEVAKTELGDAANDSRISLATGVHRRDVKHLRNEEEQDEGAVGRKVSLLGSVVGRWLSSPELTGEDGLPLSLPRGSDAGPSFDSLVQNVSTDVRPRAVLDELTRQNMVRLENDKIVLQHHLIVGSSDMDQKLYSFSQNMGDHMSVAVENLLLDPAPFLERAVYHNNLSKASVEALERDTQKLSMELLRHITARAVALQKEDRNDPSARHQFRLGLFFHHEREG